MYIGCVMTGDRGDVREIRRAINQLLKEDHEKVRVALDCHDMGVAVTRVADNTVRVKLCSLYYEIVKNIFNFRSLNLFRFCKLHTLNNNPGSACGLCLKVVVY